MLALAKKTGVPNPRLLSRPKVKAENLPYMQGYRALSQAREYSQAGMQPIRLSETLAYMKIARVRPGDHAARFLRLIQAMDAVHLEWWVKKNKN